MEFILPPLLQTWRGASAPESETHAARPTTLPTRDQPVLERRADFFNNPERPDPQELLLEHPDKPFGDVVPLMHPDKGLAGHDPEGAEFGQEIVTHVLTIIIMADLQAGRDISKHTFLGAKPHP